MTDDLNSVNVLAHFSFPCGLQQSALGLVKALRLGGVDVSCRDVRIPDVAGECSSAEICDEEVFDQTLIHVQPEPYLHRLDALAAVRLNPANYRVAYWYWEGDRLPAAWPEIARQVNIQEVWAASKFTADVLRAALPMPVLHLPPGVELTDFQPLPRSFFGIPDDRFTFLFMFDMRSLMDRKNPLAIIEAFRRAFRRDDSAQLLIRAHHGRGNPVDWRRLNAAARQAGNVIVLDREFSRAESYALIAACDCYVSLHHAEGLGLTLAEAMLLGKPAIATGYSGNMDFMTPANSYLVDCTLALAGHMGPYPPETRWAIPSVDHAAELMRLVYRSPDDARCRADRGRRDVEASLSPSVVAPRLAERLRQVSAERYSDMRKAIRSRIIPRSRMSLPAVQAAFREELAEHIHDLQPYPSGNYRNRGVVIIADSGSYDAAYGTARMFRHHGCTLPIQFWHSGPAELSRWQLRALHAAWVECVDARDHFRRGVDPSHAKAMAVMKAPFQEVLCCDAADYPLLDPTFIFESPEYRNGGALFLADAAEGELTRERFDALGVPYQQGSCVTSGPLFVDKQRCWKQLNVVQWMNDHADFYYPLLGAGCATWPMAWHILGSQYPVATGTREPLAAAPVHRWCGHFPIWSKQTRHIAGLGPEHRHPEDAGTRASPLPTADHAASTPLKGLLSEFHSDLRKIRNTRDLAVVQLGRHGDILLLLPGFQQMAKTSRLKVITLPQYGDLLKGLSNIEWVPFEGTMQQWREAAEFGKTIADEVIVSQVGWVPATKPIKNFALDGWYRAGLPDDDFHRLPLVIENRDRATEQQLVQKHLTTRKPLILWCGAGMTTPFDRASEFREWLILTIGNSFELLDIADVNAPRIQDLLGLYERARLLISIDTATLHLGYATQIPTIAFVNDIPYGASEPRSHWVWWVPYSAVFGNLQQIERVIRATAATPHAHEERGQTGQRDDTLTIATALS